MKSLMLIADLDSTLLGDDAALCEFAEWHRPRRGWLKLVYASGRRHESLLDAVRQAPLPPPEALISGVGTDVRRFNNGLPLADWSEHLAYGWSPERVRAALSRFSQLQLQPDEFQSPLKVSYHARRLRPAQLEWLRSALRAQRVHAELIYSSDRDLDVLPRGANKGAAAAYLLRRWRWPAGQVLVAGDSGNDLALFQQGFRGIVVANAHRELKALAGPRIYQSPFPFAGGVLDGLRHWLGEKATLRQAG